MIRNIRTLLNLFGVDIIPHKPSLSNDLQLMLALKYSRPDYIFDIGANEGQFGKKVLKITDSIPLISFEPLSRQHKRLKKLSKCDKRWSVYDRVAIGHKSEETIIHISENTVSSSLYSILPRHTSAEPKSQIIGKEKVNVKTLDDVKWDLRLSDEKVFLKIDTQGYEWNVLLGATSILQQTVCILCEASLVPLYEGQKGWRDIVDHLEQLGFTLWGIQRGFTDENNGQSLQVDLLFVREI